METIQNNNQDATIEPAELRKEYEAARNARKKAQAANRRSEATNKAKAEWARKRYNEMDKAAKSTMQAKKRQKRKENLKQAQESFKAAEAGKNEFPFNTQFGDFTLRFKAQYKKHFFDLIEDGYVVMPCSVEPYWLLKYLGQAERTMHIWKPRETIFDAKVPGAPKKLRFQQKLKGSQAPKDIDNAQRPTEATEVAQKWILDNITEYLKFDKTETFVIPTYFGKLWSEPVPTKVTDFLEKMQPWHCDDCVQQGIFNFSAIFNTDEHQAAKLHVCTGSHKMTHQEQWDNKVHVGYDTVTIPPGKFILFFRSLVHAGSMYETRQDRFFTYIDVGPISKKDSVQWPNPGRVYAYGDPSTKTSL